MTSLALGAAAGWPVTLLAHAPGTARRLRIAEPRRLLQAHIDWIVMGVVLIAVGVAVPSVAGWAQVALLVGAVGNPLLFLPMAFVGSGVQQTLPFRAAAACSFAALSCSLVAIAWAAW
jgi:hydroxylaminobenzene mutase